MQQPEANALLCKFAKKWQTEYFACLMHWAHKKKNRRLTDVLWAYMKLIFWNWQVAAQTCILTYLCILAGYSSCPNAHVAAFLAHAMQESRKANGMGTTHFYANVVKCSAWNRQHFCTSKDRWVSHRILVNCTDDRHQVFIPEEARYAISGPSLPRRMLQRRWGSYH